jgi:autotransporter-associated beta strand protein
MNRFVKIVFLLSFACACSAMRLEAANLYWNVASPATGYVDNPANWTPGSVPGNFDRAFFTGNGQANIDALHPFAGTPADIVVGYGSGATVGAGHVVQTGGAVSYQDNLWVSYDAAPGSSTYDMVGGTLRSIRSAGWFVVGSGGAGSMTLSGSARVEISTPVSIGQLGGASGTVSVGTIGSSTDNSAFICKGRQDRSYFGYGDGTAIWNQNSGSSLFLTGFNLSQDSTTGGSTTLNLNGGTFASTRFRTVNAAAAAVKFNFNGGVLQAMMDNGDWIGNGGAAAMNLYVKAGGAKIDSNSYSVTIAQPLQADTLSTGGGLTKLGAGALSLTAANTYTGATVVEGGTLRINGPGGTLASSGITVKNGAALGGAALALALPAVIVQSGGIIAPGDDTYGTLKLSTLSVQNKARFIFKNDAITSTGSDLLYLDSAPVVASGKGIVDFVTNTTTPATFLAPTDVMNWTWASGETAPALMPGVDSIGTSTYALTYTAGNAFTVSKIQAVFASITNEWGNGAGGAYGNVANWANSAPPAYVPGANQQALFGSLSGTISGSVVDLQANVNVGSVIFDNLLAPYTLSDVGSTGSKLTLSSTIASEAQITVVSGSHTINVPVVLGQNTRLNVYDPGGATGYALTLNGVVSGAGGLGLFEGGKLVLANTANTYAGPTVMNGGTLEVANLADGAPSSLGAWDPVASLDPTHFVLNGALKYTGTTDVDTARGITIAGHSSIDTNKNITLSGKIDGRGRDATGAEFIIKYGIGTLTFDYQGSQMLGNSGFSVENGSAVFNGGAGSVYTIASPSGLTGSWLAVGYSDKVTEVNIQSGRVDVYGGTFLGWYAASNSVSTLKLSGDSTLDTLELDMTQEASAGARAFVEISGNARLITRGYIAVGNNVGTIGTMSLSGNAHLEDLSDIYIGNWDGATGNFKLTGTSTADFAGSVFVSSGGYGAYDQTGGTTTIAGELWVTAWNNGAAPYGVLNISGGSMSTGLDSVVWYGTGNYNLSGAGQLHIGGAMRLSPPDAEGALGKGIVNLGAVDPTGGAGGGGGVLSTMYLVRESVADGTAAQLNFHGGTLKPAGNEADFIRGVSTYVWKEGAKIDTAGFNISIASALSAPTGKGVGSITFTTGSGYAAPPIVRITGDGTGAAAVATIDAGGNITGITITNPGVGYTTAPTISIEGGGGTGATATAILNAGNASGGLAKLGLGALTLSGGQSYAGDTFVNQGTLTFTTPLSTPTAAVSVAVGATLNGTSIVANSLNIGVPMQAAATAAVPEPGTLVLLALAGLGAILAWRRK